VSRPNEPTSLFREPPELHVGLTQETLRKNGQRWTLTVISVVRDAATRKLLQFAYRSPPDEVGCVLVWGVDVDQDGRRHWRMPPSRRYLPEARSGPAGTG
jgi:hypothetical protein